MPKAKELFNPYDEFEGYADGSPRFPEDYPFGTFHPDHPLFSKRGEVVAGSRFKTRTYVDLGIGECQCDNGQAFRWDHRPTRSEPGGHWYANGPCVHKLRMICGIIEAQPDERRGELTRAYLKTLSNRYNRFEVVSAFHKELRRGDFDRAWFWGLILSTYRGMRGLFQYLLNIIYEETRDHELADWLIELRKDTRSQTLVNASRAISWFCVTPKKWELPHRFEIFNNEMRAYDQLAKDYTPDVARGGNIIRKGQKAKLLKLMETGAEQRDMVKFQRGLKGLQKLQYSDREKPKEEELYDHRYWMYERLYDIADSLLPAEHSVWHVISVVNTRIERELGIGYHELNAIGDALMDEPHDAGLLSPTQRRRSIARPAAPIPLGIWPKIPLYASDNHTYRGKALMRRYPEQLKPGAQQTDLDFRWCGAYFGVAYRTISYQQHGHIAEWHETTWPKDLYRIVDMLWY